VRWPTAVPHQRHFKNREPICQLRSDATGVPVIVARDLEQLDD